MQQELIEEYKLIMVSVLSATTDREVSSIFELIENLDDDTAGVREEFIKNINETRYPSYWISILRFIRFSIVLQSEIVNDYDSFVSTYQELSGRRDLNGDESHLLKEIGEFLYNVDDVLGDHERLCHKLIHSLHEGMMEIHGYQPSPPPEFFKGRMLGEPEKKIVPHLEDLHAQCRKFVEQQRIMKALGRIRKLIYESKQGRSGPHHQEPDSSEVETVDRP